MPEYIEVPGPTEYWYPPAEMLKSCVEPTDTPLTLGYMQYGMAVGDLLGTVTQVWQSELVPCDAQIDQIRQLVEQHQNR